MSTKMESLTDFKPDATSYDAKALGSTIRILRERNNYSLAYLGGRCNISTASLSKLEQGVRVKVPIETLIKLCPYLNVSLDYLLASCIKNRIAAEEQFFDFNGKEVDLYGIAKNLYSCDAELLLLLSSPQFLDDTEFTKFIKSWIILKNKVEKGDSKGLVRTLFSNLKKYCIESINTLTASLSMERG